MPQRRDFHRFTEDDYSQAIRLVRRLRANAVQERYARWASEALRTRDRNPDVIIATMLCMNDQGADVDSADRIYELRCDRGVNHSRESGWIRIGSSDGS